MRRASIAEAQHNLSKVLSYVSQGEEVIITRRNKAVAKIVPPDCDNEIKIPRFSLRADKIFGQSSGKPLSEIVRDNREERVPYSLYTPSRCGDDKRICAQSISQGNHTEAV